MDTYKNNKGIFMDKETEFIPPHIDKEVQAYFYDTYGVAPFTSSDPLESITQLTAYYSLSELRYIYAPMGSQYARTELNYKPPWIDEELLEYSLKGLKALRV